MNIKPTDFVATVFHGRDAPKKATIACTIALKALEKGHSCTLVLMGDAIDLGLPGGAGGVSIGAPFRPLGELFDAFLAAGGQLAVCNACVLNKGLKLEQVDPRYPVIGGGDVVDLLLAARGALQTG